MRTIVIIMLQMILKGYFQMEIKAGICQPLEKKQAKNIKGAVMGEVATSKNDSGVFCTCSNIVDNFCFCFHLSDQEHYFTFDRRNE